MYSKVVSNNLKSSNQIYKIILWQINLICKNIKLYYLNCKQSNLQSINLVYKLIYWQNNRYSI